MTDLLAWPFPVPERWTEQRSYALWLRPTTLGSWDDGGELVQPLAYTHATTAPGRRRLADRGALLLHCSGLFQSPS
jgi:hypothetical protein